MAPASYGPFLKDVVPHVYGIDHDPVLCDNARKSGAYDTIVCDHAENSGSHFDAVDAVFCSEFFEHVPDAELSHLVAGLEALTRHRMVVTLPNPLSPHYRHDPTHVARYNVYSMRRRLNARSSFTYRLRPLGFSDFNRAQRWAQVLNPISANVALLSPTVAYIGDRTR